MNFVVRIALKSCQALLLLCLSPLLLAEPVSQTQPIDSEIRLDNGLKVIIREDHRAPLVAVQLWYAVGSNDESGSLLGVSHALEHMMFKGTHKVPANEFSRLSRIYGGKINAMTSSNYTFYEQVYPKAYLSLALELEADRMNNLKLDPADFESEMKVVRQERRQRTDDNAQSLAFERFRWLAYPTSTARQPVIGYMKNLQNTKLEQLKSWYETWYAPNNATLVIIGDINREAALEQVKRYFDKIPKRALPERNDVLEYSRVGYRHMEVMLPVQVPNLYMAWNVPSLKTAKNPQDAYTLSIIQSLLSSNLSSRLRQNLVRSKKVLSSVSVSYEPYSRGDSLFIITALPASGVSLSQAQNAIQTQINQLKTEAIESAELERVSANFVANLVYSQDNIAAQARLLGLLDINGLDYNLLDHLPAHYQSVTANDIIRVAKIYFDRPNLTTLYLLPEKND